MLRSIPAKIINESLESARSDGLVPADVKLNFIIEIPREEGFGDYSTNIAFILAPHLRKKPIDIARHFVDSMKDSEYCESVSVAGPGFINFSLKDSLWQELLHKVASEGIESLYPDVGSSRNVLIEFVSANPTGPLHIGHGRGAAVGDVLANLLKRTGHNVGKEYYINDAGRQIRTLGRSTYLRLKEIKGETVDYPQELYQGDYVRQIARMVIDENVPVPAGEEEAVDFLAAYASSFIMDGIKKDLGDFGVSFDRYFLESTLYESGIIDETLRILKERGIAYERDGALWFKTSLYEKDEDRVLIKSDGQKTYFTSDIAYHLDKYKRSFNVLVDIWGSDHHGYIPRLRASVQALGKSKEDLKFLLIQFVTLIKDGKPVGMSTRSGEFTTLREVMDEVGRDACRFFFLMRKSDAHLEFDLDLAKRTSNENPVYYVQYAHARIESIFRNARETGIDTEKLNDADCGLLTVKEELDLIRSITRYNNVLEGSARNLEPHRVTFYLMELVGRFHSYYNKTRVLGNEIGLVRSRLLLLAVLRDVIKDGLSLIGVSAPVKM
ncbi:MAG: argS [Deltaproteobacteria bacterium]|nr:argS [Deltaproteobacteria bacterium]